MRSFDSTIGGAVAAVLLTAALGGELLAQPAAGGDNAVDEVKAVIAKMAAVAKPGQEARFLAFFDTADAALVRPLFQSNLKTKADKLTQLVKTKLGMGLPPGLDGMIQMMAQHLPSKLAAGLSKGKLKQVGQTVVATSPDGDELTFAKVGTTWKAKLSAKDRPAIAAMKTMVDAMGKFLDEAIAGVNDGSITKQNFQAKLQALQKKHAGGGPGPTPSPGPMPAPTVTAAQKDLANNWKLFLHFVSMADPDEASSYGQAILGSKPDPRKLYYLAISTENYGSTLARGRRTKKLAPIIDKLSSLIDAGATSVRTDPKEIARWIKALGGPPRQYARAREWLIACGEYAVPQMVWTLGDAKASATLRERVVTVLPELGRLAVRPLVEALATKDVAAREVVCRALGKIGYRHAAAGLKELADTKGLLPRTRDAALGALAACAGTEALKKSVAQLYYEQALSYYDRRESVQPDARSRTANIWYWHDSLGVTYKLAPRSIFNEIYAMRAAAKVLKHDPKLEEAVSLWIAANYRKEANLPAGAKDPTLAADDPGAGFYGLAAGAKYLQAVLARALKDGDFRVAVRAIQALALTKGAEGLVKPTAKGAQPLVEALGSPSRQVRYLAAEALALALPKRPFTGSGQVVSVLVEALRQTGKLSAVLVDPDLSHRNKVKDLVRGAGVAVFDAPALGKALEGARAAGGVDLILLSSELKSPDLGQVLGVLRQDTLLRRLPVIVVTRLARLAAVRKLERADRLVVVLREADLNAAGVLAAMKSAARKAAGGGALSPQQAADWAIRAAKCFRLLGETNNRVYNLTSATKSLIAALADKRPKVRVAAAEALAVMASSAAQQALAGLADDGSVEESIRLAAYAAATKSVRLFGNKLTAKQAGAVVDVVSAKGSAKIRNAAAQLLGALSLPAEKIKELIR